MGEHPPLAGRARGDAELLGPHARDLVRAYRDADLEPDPDAGLIPDHLSLELEFVAVLLERGRRAEAAAFVGRHLDGWAPAWVRRYTASAGMRFYPVAGALLLEALRDLRRDATVCPDHPGRGAP